jgi:hypothetical protein
MYRARGHQRFSEEGGCFCFNDWWVEGLRSKSYTVGEIGDYARKIPNMHARIETVGPLFYCTLKKEE